MTAQRTIANHTAIITLPNRLIIAREYGASYGHNVSHMSIFEQYVKLPKAAVLSTVYTDGNVEITIETPRALSKTVMNEINTFIERGFILEANVDGMELVEKPAPVVVEDEHNYTLPTDEEREEQCQLAHQVMASMMGEEMATLFMEEEEEEQVAYPLHMPQPPDNLHPTHGPLPEWMYEDEQEPHTLSHAPMQQQRSATTRLCIDCHTNPALSGNERCELCYTRYLASFQNTLTRTPLVARSEAHSTAQATQTYHDNTATVLAPYAFSGRERELFDEAVQRGLALGRPFLEQEVLQQAWDEGYELMIGMDARFVLAGETATKPRLPLWLVKTQR